MLGNDGGGGGGGGGRGGVDGDKLALSGIGMRPGSVGSRVLEEGRNEERLERLPPLANHVWRGELEGGAAAEQERGVWTENLKKKTRET